MKETRTVELTIDDDIESGVYAIALVEEPAIQVDFYSFNEEFETYNDYPKGARSNACRAVEWAEKHGWGDCGTNVGKQRAHQLCNGENISRETIARMSAFRRHQQYKDTPYSEGCSGLMWDAWGGDAGISWAENKLKKIDEKLDADDVEMVEGIIDILTQVKDLENRREILEEIMKEFDTEGVEYDRDDFIKRVMGDQDFVKPHPGETEEEFIPRCMKLLIGQEGYDEKQAAAICYTYLEEKMGVDVSTLQPYIQNLKDRKKKKRYEVEQMVLKLAEEFGLTKTHLEEFANASLGGGVSSIEKLPSYKENGFDYSWIRDERVKTTLYKYEGGLRSNSREFCIQMVNLDRFYTFDMIDLMGYMVVNEGFGPRGANNYSIWKYLGGVNCYHYWRKYEYSFKEKEGFSLIGESKTKGLPGTPMIDRPRGGRLKMSYELFYDDDKMIVVGPAMIPNIEIPRKDEKGELYYVIFRPETIRDIQEKFMKTQSVHNTNQDHIEDKPADSYIIETWIKETDQDKSNKYGFGSLPIGSWFVMMKVSSKEVWRRIKDGELKGFSVEGSFIQYEK